MSSRSNHENDRFGNDGQREKDLAVYRVGLNVILF